MADTDEFKRLLKLLVGEERSSISQLKSKIQQQETQIADLRVTSKSVKEVLPDAIRLSLKDSEELTRQLQPVIEGTIDHSVRNRPEKLTNAIFPVIGPAIRKSVSELVREMLQSINTVIERSCSVQGLKWRWDAWRSGVSFSQVVLKHTLLFRVEHIFLIHRKKADLLLHVKRPDAVETEKSLLPGLLSEIKSFSTEVFPSQGAWGLRTFEVDDLTVWNEEGPDAYVVAVIRGTPQLSYRKVLHELTEQVHRDLGDEFHSFRLEGDTSFDGAKDILEAGLIEKGRDDFTPDKKGIPWRAIALIGCILLVLFAALGYRQYKAYLDDKIFSKIISAYEMRHGIVILERGKKSSSNHYVIQGLKDELATVPDLDAKMQEFSDKKIIYVWHSYLATDPETSRLRAVKVLNPPASVTVTATENEIVFTGQAPGEWLATARERYMHPGLFIRPVNLRQVVNSDSERFLSLSDQISATKFSLRPERLTLLKGERRELDAVARKIVDLRTYAKKTSKKFAVVIEYPKVNVQRAHSFANSVAGSLEWRLRDKGVHSPVKTQLADQLPADSIRLSVLHR